MQIAYSIDYPHCGHNNGQNFIIFAELPFPEVVKVIGTTYRALEGYFGLYNGFTSPKAQYRDRGDKASLHL